jgi:transposase InsO family protein
MAELCRRFGVSRVTGYRWLERFKRDGVVGLQTRSSAAHCHPNATPLGVVQQIVRLKHEHPSWGPLKLRMYAQRQQPEVSWPAASTFGEILKRHDLVVLRRRRAHTPRYGEPFGSVQAANDVWSIDFKGQFELGDGRLCYPLTVSDNFSRYLLRCQALSGPRHEPVQAALTALFVEYGLPRAIRSDNGVPFASVAVGGLSKLAVWLIKLDVKPERIAPGQPQQNGRHERMHRTLKAETANPPRASMRAQQCAFDRFRREYNEQRPHQHLDGDRPADRYRASPRPYPRRLPEIDYPSGFERRTVHTAGQIRWQGREIYLSETLIGETIGLSPQEHDRWQLYYGPVSLGVLDARRGKIIRPTHKHL